MPAWQKCVFRVQSEVRRCRYFHPKISSLYHFHQSLIWQPSPNLTSSQLDLVHVHTFRNSPSMIFHLNPILFVVMVFWNLCHTCANLHVPTYSTHEYVHLLYIVHLNSCGMLERIDLELTCFEKRCQISQNGCSNNHRNSIRLNSWNKAPLIKLSEVSG